MDFVLAPYLAWCLTNSKMQREIEYLDSALNYCAGGGALVVSLLQAFSVFEEWWEKILMQQDHFDSLFWYDVKEQTGRKAEILGMPEMFRTATCVGSLVLLDGDSVMDVDLEEGEREDEVKMSGFSWNFLVSVFVCLDLSQYPKS